MQMESIPTHPSLSHPMVLCRSLTPHWSLRLRVWFPPLVCARCIYESSSLMWETEKAFGSHADCLGIIVVRDLPSTYVSARERLLRLAYTFANLDSGIREKYADPKSRYRYVCYLIVACVAHSFMWSFGWSHGKVNASHRCIEECSWLTWFPGNNEWEAG